MRPARRAWLCPIRSRIGRWFEASQVFDDGRLTDGKGRVVDFTNTIIISTSNVGAEVIQRNLKAAERDRKDYNALKDELMVLSASTCGRNSSTASTRSSSSTRWTGSRSARSSACSWSG